MRHLADHAVRAVWGCLTMTYFHGRESPLSSALSRFTVLFGMGRSGSNSLWSSGKRRSGRTFHRARRNKGGQAEKDPLNLKAARSIQSRAGSARNVQCLQRGGAWKARGVIWRIP